MHPPVSSSKTSARSRCQAGDWPRLLCPIVKASTLPTEGSSTLKLLWAPLAKSPSCAGSRTRGLTPEVPCNVAKTSASVLAPRRSLVHVWTVYHVIGCSELQGTWGRAEDRHSARCQLHGYVECSSCSVLQADAAAVSNCSPAPGHGQTGSKLEAGRKCQHPEPLQAAACVNGALPCSIRARTAAQQHHPELCASQLCLNLDNTACT